MSEKIKLCRNGRNAPTYKDRAICHECHKKENRQRWHENKKYYQKNRLKPKHQATCKYCGKAFETAIPQKKFCCEEHQRKWHYNNRSLNDKTRAKALNKIYDKGKKRTGGIFYTKKEINMIIREYGKLNSIQIAKKLDRPVNGVRSKIRKLKEELLIVPVGAL